MKNLKKRVSFLFCLIVFFNSFAFSSDYGEQILSMYNCYSKTLETTSPFMELLSDSTEAVKPGIHSGCVNVCLTEFTKTIESYMNSSLYKYEKVMNSSLYHIIEGIYQSCCISKENINDADVVLKEYFSIQRQIIKMCHENQLNLNKSLILFMYVFIGLILALVLLSVFGVKYIALQNARKQQRENLKTIVQIQEKERERISRDLHDSVVQDIRSVLFFSKRLKELYDSAHEDKRLPKAIEDSDAGELIGKIQLIETKNLSEIRSIIKNFTPPELDKSDFSTIVADYCHGFSKNSEYLNPAAPIQCKFYVQDEAPLERLSSVQKLNLFRIIQESLNNVQKYSGAEECSVFFTYNEGKLKLIISDDGTGIQEKKDGQKESDGTKLGIPGMKTRAQMIDADFMLRSSEIGTEIIVTLNI